MLSRIRILHISDPHYPPDDGSTKADTAPLPPGWASNFGLRSDVTQSIHAATVFFHQRDIQYINQFEESECLEAAKRVLGITDALSCHPGELPQQLIERARSRPFDILVVSGDLIDSKAVSEATSDEEEQLFRRTLRHALTQLGSLADFLQIPEVIVSNGNHERQQQQPKRASLSTFIEETNRFYAGRDASMIPVFPLLPLGSVLRLFSHDTKPIGFPESPARLTIAAINSEQMDCDIKTDQSWHVTFLSKEMNDRLRACLKEEGQEPRNDKSRKDFRMVVGHSPTERQLAAENTTVAQAILDFRNVMRECNVDAYLCGHQHGMHMEKREWYELQSGAIVPSDAPNARIKYSAFACYELMNSWPGPTWFLGWFGFAQANRPDPNLQELDLTLAWMPTEAFRPNT